MSKHTPGPWKMQGDRCWVSGQGGNVRYNLWCGSVYPVRERYIGEIVSIQSCDHIDGISRDEAEANARLISSAPEMLESLESLISLNDGHSPFGGELYQDRVNRTWERARAAIAKARGE